MKWFKHDSNASLDAKLQRLRLKYGMEGYGLYWFCLESIARNVEAHNLTFELEEDSELISSATNIHRDRVQEMMTFMCELGLFENADGQISCLKMATRTDEYTQKLIRNQPKSEQSQDNILTLSGHDPDKVPPIRIEENRRDNTRRFKPPSVEEVDARIREMGYQYSVAEDFCNFYGSKNWMVGKNKMSSWTKALGGWESRKKSDMAKRQESNGEVSYW